MLLAVELQPGAEHAGPLTRTSDPRPAEGPRVTRASATSSTNPSRRFGCVAGPSRCSRASRRYPRRSFGQIAANASGRETASRHNVSPSPSTAPHWPASAGNAGSSAASSRSRAENRARCAPVATRSPFALPGLAPSPRRRAAPRRARAASPRGPSPCACGAPCLRYGRGRERGGDGAPATLFRARHRDADRGAGRDEDGHVGIRVSAPPTISAPS